MRGVVSITKEMVDNNAMGWGVFEFVHQSIQAQKKSRITEAEWYAYKYFEEQGTYEFRWADYGEHLPVWYLESLLKDGYRLSDRINLSSIIPQTIQF